MIKMKAATLVLILFSIANSYADELVDINSEIDLTGFQYLMVKEAVKQLEKHALDVKNYRISTAKIDSQKIVVFTDVNDSESGRGSSSKNPGFEVVFDENGSILRTRFAR